MAFKKVGKAMLAKAKGNSGGAGTTSRPRGMFGKVISKIMAEKAKSATANSAGMAATGMKKGGAVKKVRRSTRKGK